MIDMISVEWRHELTSSLKYLDCSRGEFVYKVLFNENLGSRLYVMLSKYCLHNL